jgi:hypothetical protein
MERVHHIHGIRFQFFVSERSFDCHCALRSACTISYYKMSYFTSKQDLFDAIERGNIDLVTTLLVDNGSDMHERERVKLCGRMQTPQIIIHIISEK